MKFTETENGYLIEIEKDDNVAEVGLMKNTIEGLKRILELYSDAKKYPYK